LAVTRNQLSRRMCGSIVVHRVVHRTEVFIHRIDPVLHR
jgi:hypothetical protein